MIDITLNFYPRHNSNNLTFNINHGHIILTLNLSLRLTTRNSRAWLLSASRRSTSRNSSSYYYCNLRTTSTLQPEGQIADSHVTMAPEGPVIPPTTASGLNNRTVRSVELSTAELDTPRVDSSGGVQHLLISFTSCVVHDERAIVTVVTPYRDKLLGTVRVLTRISNLSNVTDVQNDLPLKRHRRGGPRQVLEP